MWQRKFLFLKSASCWQNLKNSHYNGSETALFLGKGALKIFNKFTREHPCRSVISIKLQRNFAEVKARQGCSPVKAASNAVWQSKFAFLKIVSCWQNLENTQHNSLIKRLCNRLSCNFKPPIMHVVVSDDVVSYIFAWYPASAFLNTNVFICFNCRNYGNSFYRLLEPLLNCINKSWWDVTRN